MIGETSIELSDDGLKIFKTHTVAEKFRVELKYMEKAAALGVGPELCSWDKPSMTIEMYAATPVLSWFSSSPSSEEIREVGKNLLKAIVHLHSNGICHRDIHIRNLLIQDNDCPLIIDWEYAVDADPNGPCYDLIGPASNTPKPMPHRIRSSTETGVWWDTPMTSVSPVAQYFGPLSEYL